MEFKKPGTLKVKDKLNKKNPEIHNGLSSNDSENYDDSPNGFKLDI